MANEPITTSVGAIQRAVAAERLTRREGIDLLANYLNYANGQRQRFCATHGQPAIAYISSQPVCSQCVTDENFLTQNR